MSKIVVILIVLICLVAGGFFVYKNFFGSSEPAVPNENINLEAYQQAQEQVDFPVMYPSYLPEGFKFEEVKTEEGMGLGDYGDLTVTYKDDKGGQIQVFEGSGDVGMVDSLGTVNLSQGEAWLWEAGEYLGISLTSLGTTSYSYVIMTKNVSQDELIKIADSITKL